MTNSEYLKDWRKSHPDYFSKYMKKYRKENQRYRLSHNEYNKNWFRKSNYNKRHIVFLGSRIIYTFRQLTGYCSKCKNNMHDGTCKITHMHHLFYVPIMPWACRIELCASCHGKLKKE